MLIKPQEFRLLPDRGLGINGNGLSAPAPRWGRPVWWIVPFLGLCRELSTFPSPKETVHLRDDVGPLRSLTVLDLQCSHDADRFLLPILGVAYSIQRRSKNG
jgi:hypothetical protein